MKKILVLSVATVFSLTSISGFACGDNQKHSKKPVSSHSKVATVKK